jgi:hypothetical protein
MCGVIAKDVNISWININVKRKLETDYMVLFYEIYSRISHIQSLLANWTETMNP